MAWSVTHGKSSAFPLLTYGRSSDFVCLNQFSVWCPQPINRIVKNLRRKLSKDYCRLAFNKMKIPDHTTTISDSHLTEYFDKMNEEGHLEKIRQFEALRECYSAGPETLIVLDKLE